MPLTSYLRATLTGFIISMSISCSTDKAYNASNCSTVWNGKFSNFRNGEVDTEISRSGDRQIEHFKDGSITEYKVDWLDSCRYRLTPVTIDKNATTIDRAPVIVQITAVKETSYTVEGWIEGSMNKYSSELFKKGD